MFYCIVIYDFIIINLYMSKSRCKKKKKVATSLNCDCEMFLLTGLRDFFFNLCDGVKWDHQVLC